MLCNTTDKTELSYLKPTDILCSNASGPSQASRITSCSQREPGWMWLSKEMQNRTVKILKISKEGLYGENSKI